MMRADASLSRPRASKRRLGRVRAAETRNRYLITAAVFLVPLIWWGGCGYWWWRDGWGAGVPVIDGASFDSLTVTIAGVLVTGLCFCAVLALWLSYHKRPKDIEDG